MKDSDEKFARNLDAVGYHKEMTPKIKANAIMFNKAKYTEIPNVKKAMFQDGAMGRVKKIVGKKEESIPENVVPLYQNPKPTNLEYINNKESKKAAGMER